MDTTKEYIKMCEKSFKYLGIPKTNGCPNQYNKRGDHCFLLSNDKKQDRGYYPIYRQDQLQNMVIKKIIKKYIGVSNGTELLLKEFNEFVTSDNGLYKVYENNINGSMEKLWLAFVMREKYKKYWVNNDWRK